MKGTKEIVLEYLEKNKGSFFSGEVLAKELNLSRNSVWKAIESLRRDGYHIEAASRRGYSLSADSDILSVTGIASFLRPGLSPDKITIYDELESTNRTAKSAASFDAPHGSVYIADRQTRGSGRKNHTFYSPAGGIYISIILRPENLIYSHPSHVIYHTAVCICEAIEKLTDLQPSIKWTNDIYLGNKKVGGILTESGTDFETGELQWVVVGIGINFSRDTDSFPADIKEKATSLFAPGDEVISRNHLIAEILSRLLPAKINSNADSNTIMESYKKRMNMLNREINVIPKNGEAYRAIATDITETGKLEIELPGGEKKILSSEEISITLP